VIAFLRASRPLGSRSPTAPLRRIPPIVNLHASSVTDSLTYLIGYHCAKQATLALKNSLPSAPAPYVLRSAALSSRRR
jgi:hypothetical protein